MRGQLYSATGFGDRQETERIVLGVTKHISNTALGKEDTAARAENRNEIIHTRKSIMKTKVQ